MKVQLLLLLAVATTCTEALAEDATPFKDDREKLGYASGMNYGTMFLRQGVKLDPDALLRGLKDVLSSNKTILTQEQVRQTINDAQGRIREKQQGKTTAQGVEDKTDDKEKLGYALGMNYGNTFLRNGVELDPNALVRGLKDVLSSNKTLLSAEQVRQVLNDAQGRIQEKQQAKSTAEAGSGVAATESAVQKSPPEHPVWEDNFAKAQERAKSENKLVLVTLASAKDKYTIFISRAFEDYARGHLVLFNAVRVEPGEEGFSMKEYSRQLDVLLKIPHNPNLPPNLRLTYGFELVGSAGNYLGDVSYSSEEFKDVKKLIAHLDQIRDHNSVQLQWLTDLAKAKIKARDEGKCMFILFLGKQQTFGESYFRDDWDFHNTVKAGMLLVRVSQSDVIKSSLVDEFGIKEFPWVTVLSPSAEDRIVNTSGTVFLNRHNPALGGISSGEWFPGFSPATIAPFLAKEKSEANKNNANESGETNNGAIEANKHGKSVPTIVLTPAELAELRTKAENRDAAALDKLTTYYVELGDFAAAFKLYRGAADRGLASAQFEVGNSYDLGLVVTQNLPEAMQWYRRAADQDYGPAQLNLGTCYTKLTNFAEAVKCYRKAAEKGLADAQYDLGLCALDGLGVPRDVNDAMKWFRLAADQGYGPAQCNLGTCYYDSQKNYSEAAKWTRKAADKGVPMAQYNLANMYQAGEGVPKDGSEAVKWWLKSAAQGNAQAQHSLGCCYQNAENGLARDMQEAMKWYRRAADQGHAGAQCNLANCYSDAGNNFEAAKWFEKAAVQGLTSAQYNLGTSYGLGRGLPKDDKLAYFWLTLAVTGSEGDEQAMQNRAIVARILTPDAIAECQRKAAAFVPQVNASPAGSEPTFGILNGKIVKNEEITEAFKNVPGRTP